MLSYHESPPHFNLVRLGARLRSLRTQQSWTLGDLAQRTGLSEAYLSRIESGDRQPSLAALFTLTCTYHISMAALFEEEPLNHSVVVRQVDATVYQGNGLLYRLLSNQGDGANLRPIHITIPANRQNEHLYHHEGEEWLYVLLGQLRLTLGDEVFTLSPGEAAHFDARMAHRLDALNQQDAEILVVSCEASHMLLRSYL